MARKAKLPSTGRAIRVENLLSGSTLSGVPLHKVGHARLRDWLEVNQDIFREHFLIRYGEDGWKEALGASVDEAARYSSLGEFLDSPIQQVDLLAAYGILSVDRTATKFVDGASGWDALFDACDLGECEHYVSLAITGNDSLVGFLASAQIREAARNAAIAGHALSPKFEAKRIVRECWEEWERQPAQYGSTAAFARAMLDKFPDELKSQPVIERWVRHWRSGVE